MFATSLRLLCLLVLLIGSNIFSQAADQQTENIQSQQLQKEITQLRAEVNQLKTEVQQLRQLLVNQPAASTTYSNPSYNQKSNSSSTGEDTGYWLTTSSNKRHNSSCRYYKASRGRPCGANEGIACKICGG